MPTPMYVICSQGVSTDRDTGLYSIFEVIEKLIVTELPKPKEGEGVLVVERQKIVVTSNWMIDLKNGDSFDDQFEFNMVVRMESGETIMETTEPFKFASPDRPAHRMTVNLLGTVPIKQTGVLVFECRCRKAGSQNWKSHNYKMLVEKQKIES